MLLAQLSEIVDEIFDVECFTALLIEVSQDIELFASAEVEKSLDEVAVDEAFEGSFDRSGDILKFSPVGVLKVARQMKLRSERDVESLEPF